MDPNVSDRVRATVQLVAYLATMALVVLALEEERVGLLVCTSVVVAAAGLLAWSLGRLAALGPLLAAAVLGSIVLATTDDTGTMADNLGRGLRLFFVIVGLAASELVVLLVCLLDRPESGAERG